MVFFLIEIGVLSPRIKRLGFETDNSALLSCEMKNDYSCTSIPLIGLLGLGFKSRHAVIFQISNIL